MHPKGVTVNGCRVEQELGDGVNALLRFRVLRVASVESSWPEVSFLKSTFTQKRALWSYFIYLFF